MTIPALTWAPKTVRYSSNTIFKLLRSLVRNAVELLFPILLYSAIALVNASFISMKAPSFSTEFSMEAIMGKGAG